MKKFIAALAVSTALLVSPAVAQGNADCGTAAQAQGLVDKYKEIPIMTYVDSKKNVIMVYANLETGTVSVILSPIGSDYFCLVSQGKQAKIGGPKRKGTPGVKRRPAPTWNRNGGDV